MTKTVILAEKPSQAKSYAQAFNSYQRKDGYYQVKGIYESETVITYGYGHLVELYDPTDYNQDWKKWQLDTLPIFPKQYQFKVSKDKKKQFNIVKKQLNEADEIVIGTDSDREGEAIARLIIRLSGNQNKPIKRLWINSLETDEIQKGLKTLKSGENFYSTFKSAETRQIADWLVGINLTRLYTLYMQQNGLKGTFTIGRVQTPTLFLIYQRNQEIEQFQSKPFFELYAHFEHENGTYTGKYKERFSQKDELTVFQVEHELNNQNHATVNEVNVEEKKQYAPQLFSLSDLQTLANKRFKYGASKTLSIAQTLYEKKLLSYPRSDSNYIGTPEFEYLKSKLADYLELADEQIENPQLEAQKRYVDSDKVQEHYAIIPTKTLPQLDKLSKEEKNIYLLVLYRTLTMFEHPYIYDETTIETLIADVPFHSKGKTEKQIGWKRLIQDSNDKKEEQSLPSVAEQDTLNYELQIKEGKTQPPKHYTEGTLLTAMKNVSKTTENQEDKDILKETEGIGTEATRANIIDTLKKQKYIIENNGKLYVLKKGNLLCSMIADEEITNAEMTATWERYLKQIQEQTGTQEKFLTSIQNFISHLIDQAPETFQEKSKYIDQVVTEIEEEQIIGTCPNCQNHIVDKGKFYGCDHYPNCTFSLPKKWSKKTITKNMIQDLLSVGKTNKLNGFKSKKGNKYSARLVLTDEFNISMEFD